MNKSLRVKNLKKDRLMSSVVKRLKQGIKTPICKIIVFGSRVKGTTGPDSDYDILLVLKEKREDIINRLYDVVLDFLLEEGIDISLKIYTEKDFNEKMLLGTPFMIELRKTGVEVWSQE